MNVIHLAYYLKNNQLFTYGQKSGFLWIRKKNFYRGNVYFHFIFNKIRNILI